MATESAAFVPRIVARKRTRTGTFVGLEAKKKKKLPRSGLRWKTGKTEFIFNARAAFI